MLTQISAAMDNQKNLAIRMMAIQIVNLVAMYYILVVLKLSVVEMVISIAVVNILGELSVITIFAKNNLNISFSTILMKGLLPGLMPGLIVSLFWIVVNQNIRVTSYVDLGFFISPGFFILVTIIYVFGLKQDKEKIINMMNTIQKKLKN